ncbi:MAG TPA: DHH family phosphoesterase, partial [Anaeromyxobacteraceae bacterium]|nr:DHH family phosphoesterase [Anaeromyxobacteraceae bacterium]
MKATVPTSEASDEHPASRLRGVRTHRMTLRARPGPAQREKLDKLVHYARGHRRALILTHDNPDPDSLAAGVALAWLLERLAGVEAQVAYGGLIGRAENRALIKVLRLPVVPVSRVAFDDFDLICMVDTQPEQGNHSLPPRHFPDVVIDHHPMRPDSHLAAIADVGGPIGATSTVVVEYVRASRLEIPQAIATALFYGIKADTRDLGRQTTPQDVEAYLWLFPRVDKDAMGAIEHPALPAAYFALSHTAIEQAIIHDDAVVAPLGRLYAPDMVAEVAERFLSIEGMRWSLAYGEYEGDLYYSVRTTDGRSNAGKLIREVIEPRGGSAGGHGTMAGARLPLEGRGRLAMKRLEAAVVRDFLEAFG